MIEITAEETHEDLVKWWRGEVRKALKMKLQMLGRAGVSLLRLCERMNY